MVTGFETDLQIDLALLRERLAERAERDRASRSRPSNQLIAQKAGISERHLYRLRKHQPSNDGPAPDTDRRPTPAAQLLRKLGKWDLIGTPAEQYLNDFICELIRLLNLEINGEEIDIDVRWAKANACEVVRIVKDASERRREKLRRIHESDF